MRRFALATHLCLGLLLAGCAEKQKEAPRLPLDEGRVFQGRSTREWLAALGDPDPAVRLVATGALGEIRDPATAPALIGVFKDENPKIGFAAAFALGKIGAGTVPALVEALRDPDETTRRLAGAALWKMGPGAKGAVAALGGAIEDDSAGVRMSAVAALGNIGPEAVPALVRALGDEDAGVRKEAALALGRVGPDARDARTPLGRMRDDAREDEEVRDAAADALERIGEEKW